MKIIRELLIKTRRVAEVLLLSCLLLWLGQSARAQKEYLVQIDTSALQGQSGYIDFQFNPGTSDALSGSALLSSIFTDSIITSGSDLSGGASGNLPAGVTIDNSTSFNDVFQYMTFGTKFNFDAKFSGPAFDPAAIPLSGSTFAVSLYDTSGYNPLLTTDLDGTVLQLQVAPDGKTLAQNFPSDSSGGLPVANAAPVPEASTLVGFGLMTALGGLGLMRSKKNGKI